MDRREWGGDSGKRGLQELSSLMWSTVVRCQCVWFALEINKLNSGIEKAAHTRAYTYMEAVFLIKQAL